MGINVYGKNMRASAPLLANSTILMHETDRKRALMKRILIKLIKHLYSNHTSVLGNTH